MIKQISLLVFLVLTVNSLSFSAQNEQLVKFQSADPFMHRNFIRDNGGQLTEVSKEGRLYLWTSSQNIDITWGPEVDYVQKNFDVQTFHNPSLIDNQNALQEALPRTPRPAADPFPDNPAIPEAVVQGPGVDTLLSNAWGFSYIAADKTWKGVQQDRGIIVAVTDTGIDYTHPDLINSMWRNTGEIPNDGIDNDNNGYIDDTVGWDFYSNDNKPYDLSKSLIDILFSGGNPGHGTHVSGVIAAQLNNGQGIAGVAPKAKLMACRFINEFGKGKTAGAVQAIDYAVNNGANIINASWGGEKGDENDSALEDAILRAEKKGVIFVAAAGNGRLNSTTGKSEGFNNDTDKKPILPASFPLKNVVTVAAIDSTGGLASFSNFGKNSVKLGAPGVKILSTVPGNRYQDTIIDIGQVKATWDGTSMAAPFVSGSLAVVWSKNRRLTSDKVIESLLANTKPLDSLKDKVYTNGHVDLTSFVK